MLRTKNKIVILFFVMGMIIFKTTVFADEYILTVNQKYRVLDSVEYEDYIWTSMDNTNSPYLPDGRREVEWNMDSDHSMINNGVHTINASINNNTFGKPGTVTCIGSGLYTKNIKCIQMRVRVSTESHFKLYYQCSYPGGADDNFSEEQSVMSEGKVQGDGRWHIISFNPNSINWTNSEDRQLKLCWFQATDNPKVWEIDWIRFMGEGTVKAISTEKTGTIIKYDNSDGINFAKNDRIINPGISYDPVSQSLKCNGNIWSYNCDIYADGIGISPSMLQKTILRVKADKLMNIKLEYRRNFNESSDTSIAVDTKSFYVPGDGLWHDIELESTFDTVNGVDQIGQLYLIPQTISAKDNTYNGTDVSADGDYYIKFVELYGTATTVNSYKYEANTPLIHRGEDECRVVLPGFANYSSDSINLGLIAASYFDGKLTEAKLITNKVNAGKVSPACEVTLPLESPDSEVKAFMWDMDNLKPIDLNELYNDDANSYSEENNETEILLDADDDKEVKVYVDDLFSEPIGRIGERWLSGWKQEVIGGCLERGNGMTAIIDDNSDKLPMVFVREFENMTYGEAFMNVILRFDTNVDGAKWALRCGEDEIMGFTSVDGNIVVLTPDGLNVIVENYKFANNYNIKFTFDVDKQIVHSVYVDGKLVAENISFLTPVSKINNFVMRTENETVGRYEMDSLKIYRGYKVFENFSLSSLNIPDDWENVVGTARIYDTMLELNGNKKVRKTYTREKRKTVTEFYLYMPSGREGFKVSINDGDKRIGGISSTNEGFAYFSGNSPSEEFYKQLPNVMYNFRLETDFENHSMDVFMNNRLMKSGIPLPDDVTGTDNLTVENASDGGNIYFTNVTVKPVIEYEDYCPEPQVPEKDDIDIIMQMCPMWAEGTHFGYDHLNASPGRKPLMGFYDESDSEAMDWIIKYMVEHGVDVRMSVWYRHGGVNAPMREYTDATGMPQYKAMQNAKYADKMKWCILWENSGSMELGSPEENLDAFLKYIAPYWIEYYFKDSNYYKINGRPVVGTYNFKTVASDFTSDTKVGIDKFRQMCIDAGVGNPLFLQDVDVTGQESEENLDLINDWGIDLHSQYHQGSKYFEETKVALETTKEYVIKNNYSFQTIPVINPGFDNYAWGIGTGVLWDNEMMKEALIYMRDEYFVDLPTPTGKKMMLLATWDEYGEGHYFAPSEGNGFGFLDAVREVFVGGEHEDILPTENQLDRFNNRYPSWREAPFTIEKMVSREIPENSYVKRLWSFDRDGDFGGWENAGGFSSLEVKDGYLKCVSDGGRGSINFFANEEYSDVVQVRVKYRNMSSAYNAKLYYQNQFMNELTEKNAISEHIKLNCENGELVFSTGKYPLDWKGIVNELLMAFEPMNKGEKLYIDSIELIARKPDESKMKLNVNGYVTEVDGSIISSGDAMVPIRDLAWIMRFDDRVYYDKETNTYMYRSYSDNKIVVMPAKGDTFTINDTKYPSENHYRIYDDGIFRVSSLWVKKVFEKNSYYSNEENTFFITDRSLNERSIIWSADFSSGMDNFIFGRDTSGKVDGGMLMLHCTDGDPQIINNKIGDMGIDCKDLKNFAIRTTSKVPCIIKVYYSTTLHPEVSEENAFFFSIPATDEAQVFNCDISEQKNFEGIIKYIRIDVERNLNNDLNVDYIRFYGDFEREIQ